MVRIAISQAAFDAIVKTLPIGSAGYENAGPYRLFLDICPERDIMSQARPMRNPRCALAKPVLNPLPVRAAWT
jgi:hypothetical protein